MWNDQCMVCPSSRELKDQAFPDQDELDPAERQSQAGRMDMQVSAKLCKDEDSQAFGVEGVLAIPPVPSFAASMPKCKLTFAQYAWNGYSVVYVELGTTCLSCSSLLPLRTWTS